MNLGKLKKLEEKKKVGQEKFKLAIEFSKYSFSYTDQKVLKNISMKVYDGDFVTIIGPNGSGKSSLLKSLSKILTGGEGDILVNGKHLQDYSQKDLAKEISYVPQGLQSFREGLAFNVYEFVLMGRYPYSSTFSSMKKAKDHETVIRVLKQIGIYHFKDRSLDTLSGGELQKVFIATALAQGGKIILLDEPASHLDPKQQLEIYQLLMSLNSHFKRTLLLVTQDVNSVLRYGKQVFGLQNGSIFFSESRENLTKTHYLSDLFGVSFRFVVDPQSKVKVAFSEAFAKKELEK